jgi:transcription antitermination protein NusB
MGLRRDGREAAVQYLFAHELHEGSGKPTPEEIHGFWELHTAKPQARKFAEELTQGVLENLEEIDRRIAAACVNFHIDRLGNVDRNILRLGAYELQYIPNLPKPVIMNEAIEIAKKFGAPESAGFVNGVLDKIAREVRQGQERPAPVRPAKAANAAN